MCSVASFPWVQRSGCSTGASLFEKSKLIEAAANNEIVLKYWSPFPAHLEPVNPSFSMIAGAVAGKSEKEAPLLLDKRVAIENFHTLLETGKIALKEDISLVFEGCDTGNYFPLVFTAVSSDGKKRKIRAFFTNGSDPMVQ